jgi:hypothetical protein
MRQLNLASVSRWLILLGVAVISGPSPAEAQLLFSFEDGLQGWHAANATLAQSPFGATDGSMAMLIDDLTPSFKNDVGMTGNFNGNTAGFESIYGILNEVGDYIAAGGNPKLEFDLTTDLSNVSANGYMQLGMFIQSNAGFKEYGTGNFLGGNALTSWPIPQGNALAEGVSVTSIGAGQVRVAVPLQPRLQLAGSGATYYDIGFKSNGGWTGTADFAMDNFRITGMPVYNADTLFSWETPDNPATTGIDERYEGWTTGFQDGHVHSITSSGATDGTHALQIDRTGLENGFSWGSQFQISSDTNPDPNITEIDSSIQSQIDDLVSRIVSGDRVAFDVTATYNGDPFPDPEPANTAFAIHFTDQDGIFYQKSGPTIHINQFPIGVPTTTTIQISLDEFVDTATSKNLKIDGFVDGTNYLRIGVATNTNGGFVYQIDNFCILTADTGGLAGDYNGDGKVDAADYTVWRDNFGATDESSLNGNGDGMNGVDAEDYALWKLHFGETATGSGSVAVASVPEPFTSGMAMLGMAAAAFIRRKSNAHT